jgi:hypothetical protein
MEVLLEDKNAVIRGAEGVVGGNNYRESLNS